MKLSPFMVVFTENNQGQGCRGQRLAKDNNPIQVPPKDRPGGDSENSTQKSWWPDNDAVLTKLGHRGDGEAHQTL